MTVTPPPAGQLRRPKNLHERDKRELKVPGPRALQWMIVVLLVVGGVSCVVKGADEPADPVLREATRQPITGFGEIAYRINTMPAATRCALLAETAEQHGKGLMRVTDLGGYDGMLFVFSSDTTSSFYMKDTPMPLSIAWFDSGGRFVSATDMEPCLNQAQCPLYNAPGTYRYALEVPRGGLEALGVGAGSVISVGGPCA